MGHEERTVRLGLQWLEERGQIRATELEEEFSIKPGPGSGEGDLSTESPLREALDEAQAYRTYAFQGEETLARQSV
jgi:single-stranded-DNA-specific exonuclease